MSKLISTFVFLLAAIVIIGPGCASHSSATADSSTSPPPAAARRLSLDGIAAENPVAQPTTIPGQFAIAPQPLPDLAGIVAAPTPGSLIYGLYTWAGEYKTHRQSIRQVGWHSFRIGGPFDDEIMRMVVEDGVEVMKTVGRKNRMEYESEEAFLAAYAAEITEFLQRYGPRGSFFTDHPNLPHRPITHVEIWNEPNFQYLIPDRQPRAEVEAEREALYPKLLAVAHQAVKARWKDVQVVGFAAGGASAGDLRFIKNIHDRVPAVVNHYDILSTHPYAEPEPPDAYTVRSFGRFSPASSLAQHRKVLADAGTAGAAGKPIWYTEVGWPVSKADGGHFDTPAGRAMVSPMLQAAYVCRIYALSLRLGVGRTHIMFTTDTDNFNAGFFLRDNSWRPSATAVAVMTRVLPNPNLVGVISEGDDGYFAYQFNTGDIADAARDVIMAWNVAGPREVTLPVAMPEVEIIDMLGHVRRGRPLNGQLTLTVGPLPIYIRLAE